jgi:hypothetical protein
VFSEQVDPALGNPDPEVVEAMKMHFEDKDQLSMDSYDMLRDNLTQGYGGPNRFGVSLKMPDALIYFLIKSDNDKESAKKILGESLIKLNDEWKAKCDLMIKEAVVNIEKAVRFMRL